MQRDLDQLGGWEITSHKTFNKSECQMLHLGQGSLGYFYRLRDEAEKQPHRKGLADGKLNMSQNCALAVQRANHTLGCSRPHTISCALLGVASPQVPGAGWMPQCQKHMKLLDRT